MSKSAPKSVLSVTVDYFLAEWAKGQLLTSPTIEVIREIPIVRNTVVITGANSGIGADLAYKFARRGARVIMACKDMKKGEKVANEIRGRAHEMELVLVPLDLADLDSVRACASEIRKLAKKTGISILLNNAGIFDPATLLQKTKDGFETHMGVNYLGPFLLTNLLLDLVIAAGRVEPSRVVFTSSLAHQFASLDLEDLMLDKRGPFGLYNFGPYSNSKLATMYNAYSLAKRLRAAGGADEGINVTVYAVCPGLVQTDLNRNVSGLARTLIGVSQKLLFLSPSEGAEAVLYCALSRHCGEESGLMYRCKGLWEGAMERAVDPGAAEHLWNMSEKLVGHTLVIKP